MQAQDAYTRLIAGCGHLSIVRLSMDPQAAAAEILQVMSTDCIPCRKAIRRSIRGICWVDVNGK